MAATGSANGSPSRHVLADLVEGDEAEALADRLDVALEHRLADEHARHLGLRCGREVGDHAVVSENQRTPLLARLARVLLEAARTRDGGRKSRSEMPAPAVSSFVGHGRI